MAVSGGAMLKNKQRPPQKKPDTGFLYASRAYYTQEIPLCQAEAKRKNGAFLFPKKKKLRFAENPTGSP